MRMAQALRESEERYRTLTEFAPDGIFLVGTDGEVLFVNSAGSRLVDADPESLRGKNIRELFPPDLVDGWLPALRAVAESPGKIFTAEGQIPGDGGGGYGLRRASSRWLNPTAPPGACSGSAATSPNENGRKSSSGSRPRCSRRWRTP
ncbi:PAS domain-containing protein [Methanoculleus chikugoensis]|uniref:PAS domain-containing protein n=1 Tax=Methanoculleus chikugoensis TaxID=118126 RepID=UPI001FB436A5|nr:PAS domain-containing protein [Methanoculleus chikugoensis]